MSCVTGRDVSPTEGVRSSFSPIGAWKVKFCSSVVKKRNSSILAKFSPAQLLLPRRKKTCLYCKHMRCVAMYWMKKESGTFFSV